MKADSVKHFAVWVFVILALACVSGCASLGRTKPNPVFQGPYPAKYYELAKKNPLLAQELGKLPEFQDGISPAEAAALEKIVDVYDSNPAAFDNAFKQMYQVGKPDVRKYCSPLQAVFWLAEDGKLSKENNPTIEYSLNELLDQAWVFDKFFLNLSEKDTAKVIEGIKDKDNRNWYANALRNPGRKTRALRQMVLDFENMPEMFSKEAREMVKESLVENTRWKDFDTVVDRLNAPELLDCYIDQNFTKITSLESKSHSVRDVFTSKEGFCVELAMFGINALRRAGYDAAMYWDMKSPIKTYMPPWVLSGHVVAAYKAGERMCIFVDFTTRGNTAHECMGVKLFKQNYVLRTQPLW